MFEIPLFPLNTVLFPGMPLSLHIFEERYKLMIGRCIEEQRPFGVVMIQEGREALAPLAEPHEIGCAAQITQVQRLEQGRMNIGTLGRERFRLISLDRSQPYLVGQAEYYPLTVGEKAAASSAARRLQPWVSRYMDVLSQLDGVELDADQLPNKPVDLAYLAAMLLQIPAEQKQELLAADQAENLLHEMRGFYRREVALAKSMVANSNPPGAGIFSLN